jgi:tetratricopeptide (TPR) repeat protein
MLGAVYLKVGDIDNSIKFYDEFIAKSGGNELKALAYNGLGYCHEAKGDFAGAYKYFEEAAKSPEGTAFRGTAYLNAGRAAEQLKDRQKALESYRKALESKNDSITEMFLKRKISELE